MIFVDTNYFLRFLLKDNEQQFTQVKQLFEKAAMGEVKLFTSLIVFFEIYWVLSSFYKRQRVELIRILRDILSLGFIKFESGEILTKAVLLFAKTKLDLEDCYNLTYAKEKAAEKIATFDKKMQNIFGGK